MDADNFEEDLADYEVYGDCDLDDVNNMFT